MESHQEMIQKLLNIEESFLNLKTEILGVEPGDTLDRLEALSCLNEMRVELGMLAYLIGG